MQLLNTLKYYTQLSQTLSFSLLLQNLYRWAGVNALPTGYSLPKDTPSFQHAKNVQYIGSDVSNVLCPCTTWVAREYLMPILYEHTTVWDSYFSDTRLLVREQQERRSSLWMAEPGTEGNHDIGSGPSSRVKSHCTRMGWAEQGAENRLHQQPQTRWETRAKVHAGGPSQELWETEQKLETGYLQHRSTINPGDRARDRLPVV